MASFLERQLRMVRVTEHGLHQRRLHVPEAEGTILYIHGLGESALCFERLMADKRLAHFQHLAVDLEGYGKSNWASEPRSLDEHADRLHELISKRALGAVVVLGHSMGGVIGTRLCEQLGAAASALINVEGNVSLPDCGYSSRAVKYSRDDWLRHGFDDVLDTIYHHEGGSAGVRRAYGASIQMCDPRAFHRNSEELVEISKAEIGARRLAALDTAVIYVHGSPRGTGARSLELLEQAGIETQCIEGAGHWPFLDQHDSFVQATAAFLARRPAEIG